MGARGGRRVLEVLVGADGWWVQVGVGGCWWVLIVTGGCWRMLVGAAQHPPTPLPHPAAPMGVCERNPGVCGPGRCVPRGGGYTCLCHPGFWLSTQGTHCIGEGGPHPRTPGHPATPLEHSPPGAPTHPSLHPSHRAPTPWGTHPALAAPIALSTHPALQAATQPLEHPPTSLDTHPPLGAPTPWSTHPFGHPPL